MRSALACQSASKASSLVSVASKHSAGARWLRPAVGWPVSASITNFFAQSFSATKNWMLAK